VYAFSQADLSYLNSPNLDVIYSQLGGVVALFISGELQYQLPPRLYLWGLQYKHGYHVLDWCSADFKM
jgi:hypothetical protein